MKLQLLDLLGEMRLADIVQKASIRQIANSFQRAEDFWKFFWNLQAEIAAVGCEPPIADRAFLGQIDRATQINLFESIMKPAIFQKLFNVIFLDQSCIFVMLLPPSRSYKYEQLRLNHYQRW